VLATLVLLLSTPLQSGGVFLDSPMLPQIKTMLIMTPRKNVLSKISKKNEKIVFCNTCNRLTRPNIGNYYDSDEDVDYVNFITSE
jgi:hypothetical protein